MTGVLCVGGQQSVSRWALCFMLECTVIKTQLKNLLFFSPTYFFSLLNYADEHLTELHSEGTVIQQKA